MLEFYTVDCKHRSTEEEKYSSHVTSLSYLLLLPAWIVSFELTVGSRPTDKRWRWKTLSEEKSYYLWIYFEVHARSGVEERDGGCLSATAAADASV